MCASSQHRHDVTRHACCRLSSACLPAVQQVRGALVLDEGEVRWPAPPPPSLAAAAAAAPAAVKKEEEVKGPKDLYPDTLRNALTTTGAAAATLAIGAVSPSSAFSGMLTKFGLASICGYQTVWGVSPALHSPLMSVTNAISGLTAVGGMVLAGGGVLPSNTAQVISAPRSWSNRLGVLCGWCQLCAWLWLHAAACLVLCGCLLMAAACSSWAPCCLSQGLAALAVLASAVNIGGGFTITQRMLDMFKRPDDPIEHNNLYAIPGMCACVCVWHRRQVPAAPCCALVGRVCTAVT